MKICFIADGSSDHTQVIANYFAKNTNNEVHLISPSFINGYDSRIITHKLKSFPLFNGSLFKFISFVLWIIESKIVVAKIKPDIVNGHYITIYGFLASLTYFRPLVVTAWGSDILIQPKRNIIWKVILKYTLNKVDLLVCLFNKEMIEGDITKLVHHNLTVASLPHGIDTNLFKRSNEVNNLRQKYAIDETVPIIINTRGLDLIYDPLTFIRAIPLVVKECPRVMFMVTYQKERKNQYQTFIKKLNIENNFIVLDWMSSEELAEHLAIADIFVSTALSDGSSNALFEGMACELLPVVTDIPANRCWIQNGINGYLFCPGNHNDLARILIFLVNDNSKEKWRLFGQKSREIVLEKAEYKTQMAKTEMIYQELIKSYLEGK